MRALCVCCYTDGKYREEYEGDVPWIKYYARKDKRQTVGPASAPQALLLEHITKVLH
jgi:hypothetical protein